MITLTAEISRHPSPDMLALHARLVASTIGELIPYEELNQLVGRDVQHHFRHLLNAARNKAQQTHGIVFHVVTNKGVVHLDEAGKVEQGYSGIARARSAIRKGRRVLGCVKDVQALSSEKKVDYFTAVSVLGALDLATCPKRVEHIKGGVKQEQRPLPITQVAKAMME